MTFISFVPFMSFMSSMWPCAGDGAGDGADEIAEHFKLAEISDRPWTFQACIAIIVNLPGPGVNKLLGLIATSFFNGGIINPGRSWKGE